MIFDKHNETHDKYVQAFKIMDKEHVSSEYTKVAETPEEKEFMRQSNKQINSKNFMFNLSSEKFNKIFRSKK